MRKTNTKRHALFTSVISLLLCVSMLMGTTFAWFTDSVKSGINTIAAGVLDVELYHSNAAVTEQKVDSSTQLFLDLQGDPILWEPGVVSYENLRVTNEGDLALAYQLTLNTANENYILDPSGAQYGLSQILKVGVVPGGITATDRAGVVASVADTDWTTLANFLRSGSLLPEDGKTQETWGVVVYWQPGENDNFWNLNNGKQLSSGEMLQIDLGVKLVATQESYESDSFGTDFDAEAKPAVFPNFVGGSASATVIPNEQNQTSADVTLSAGAVAATVPAGVQLADGTTELQLNVSMMGASGSNITLGENEDMRSLDVHIAGVAANNTTPITVTLKEAAPMGLNLGNYKVYHVEESGTKEMTLVAAADDFTAHNQFKYDPATGDVTLYMATFSEVALIADTENKWEGKVDHSWYKDKSSPYTIANADQLWSFSQIVGGMAEGIDRDSFKDKTVKLISDINLGDKEESNNSNLIFYPIGYYNSEGTYERTNTAITSGLRNFEGTFDGNGHTISNFYHNTWEMKGDHDWYSPEEQYYRDGMGLFGRVYGGTVMNVAVSNFSSDGEIATTGCIAAYADGATFENIAIFNCNPRVYNIGNGGIVGCVGWYAKEADLKTTFKNITVDNSNKISALWGSYDVACGGIVGQYYPTSGQTSAGTPANGGISFENCHVSAIMDVYNDVCANYQYYAYRYTGMLIGSVRENVTIDGHAYPKMDGITAKDCTVHFGTWNDYYYCEIIDNTTASYTHDYQMSRLTEIKAIDGTTITYLDGTTGTVPASGRANYVIVDYTKGHGTENATCYHFKDGAVWTHDMGGIQTGIDENGDGKDDLKEDKQHIYLEFNNLVTGYGWGVTTKVVGELAGVTILDREVGNSVVKFEGKVNELANNKEYKLGDIFNFVDKGVTLVPSALAVAVNNLDENNPVSATIVYDRENWENGTLTLTGTGDVQITIQDYYFCTPTTIEVTVTDRQLEAKFEVAFDHDPDTAGKQNHVDDYLYRVGNENAVSLSSLFAMRDGAAIVSSSVAVSTEKLSGNVSSTYTANSDWAKGTIKFSGTGIVKVTITDNDYCTPTELKLEVVNAKNITTATGTTKGEKFVLLCNVNATSYMLYTNSTLYGNGFTYSLKGAPTNYESKQGHGVLIANGATFDNVVVIGDVYETYGAYTNQNNYNAAIHATNTIIQNCYVANCATPVRGNDVTIIDSTLYGGTVANLILSSGTNTLKNVTTVNYNDDRNVIGLGIVVNDEAAENTKIVIDGSLKQYNYVCQTDSSKVPGDEAKALFNSMFGDNFNVFKTGNYINTGIVIMSESLNTDIIVGSVEGYEKLDDAEIELKAYGITKTVNGAVYAPKGEDAAVDNDYKFVEDNHASNVQGAYLPTFELDLGGYYDANDGESDVRYCYESVDNKTVRLLYQDGKDPFTFNLTELASVTKFGSTLKTTVTCKDSSGNILATNSSVTLKNAGMYVFEITVNDNIIYGADGELTGESVTRTYVVDVELSVKKASWKNAEITLQVPGAKSGYNNSKYYVLDFLPAITITDYAEDGTTETVNLKAEYDSYEISYVNTTSYAWSGFTLTINYKDGRVLTVTFGAPSGLSSPGSSAGGKTISLKSDNTHGYLLQSDGKINSKVSGTWPITKCTFKGANTVTVEKNESVNINVDKNTTINISSGSGGGSTECVTPDTLITLADGTQKRVDQLTGNEQLLVWNLETGKYEAAPIVFVDSEKETGCEIIHLYFSDGSDVKVISEHGFFDLTLGKYVYIDADNYTQYLDHQFVTAGNVAANTWKIVTLDDVVIEKEVTTAWSPVTFQHLCYYTNGVLSMPGGIEGLFNIFDVDLATMRYDAKKKAADIKTYGLFTLEDFGGMIPEIAFEAFNGAYLKVAMGKGLLTWEDIAYMAERYIPLMK